MIIDPIQLLTPQLMKLVRQILAPQNVTWTKCVHLIVAILMAHHALSADVLMDTVEKDAQVSTCNPYPCKDFFKPILQILMNVKMEHVMNMLTVVILLAATGVCVRMDFEEMDIIAQVKTFTYTDPSHLHLQIFFGCRY